jgi:hypothetical protein
MIKWDDKMDSVIRQCVIEKMALSAIGERLGVSRHAVWGRVRRLRLAGLL